MEHLSNCAITDDLQASPLQRLLKIQLLGWFRPVGSKQFEKKRKTRKNEKKTSNQPVSQNANI